jgi:DNA mismatch repair protein MutL
MARVQRLPEELANQIAAGEVVERPASVIKELVENCLDAGATRVQVDVEGGGVELLRVVDDGVGMSEEDALLAVERHATSKIGEFDDLLKLATYGFRGEALPSIASVSRFLLKSRSRDAEAGVELRIEAGAPPQIRPSGAAFGTTIEVRDLFFNVPARRKFLKAAGTESAHISDVIENIALASPQLTITLRRDGRLSREWLKRATKAERARETFENEELAELTGTRGDLQILALLGRPERARASGSALKLFVNGRPIRDRVLQRAVSQAYGSVLEPGRFPLGVVFLDLPADQVDVNVHPQKAEVRFADARGVADAVFSMLSQELGRSFGLPAVTHPYRTPRPTTPDEATPPPPAASHSPPGAPATPSGPRLVPSPAAWPAPSASAPAAWPAASPGTSPARPPGPAPTTLQPATHTTQPIGLAPLPPLPPSAPGALPTPAPPPVAESPWAAVAEGAALEALVPALVGGPPGQTDTREPYSALRFLVQVRNTFLICEGKEGIYILDQHAAAERVTFHRLKRAFGARSVAIQPLLFPIMADVQAEEAALVEEQHDLLLSAGMDVRAVGPRSVAIHGVPQILKNASPERLLRDLLAEASRGGHAAFSGAVDLALATMACHGSVRAGDRMGPDEATSLLAALDGVDFAGHCPHGRPVVTMMRWAELERKVGRR